MDCVVSNLRPADYHYYTDSAMQENFAGMPNKMRYLRLCTSLSLELSTIFHFKKAQLTLLLNKFNSFILNLRIQLFDEGA